MRYWIAILCFVVTLSCFGQQVSAQNTPDTTANNTSRTIEDIPYKSLDYIDKKYSKLSDDVQKQSEKVLKRMQDKEAKLQRKLQNIDSTKAKELFEASNAKYLELQNKVKGSVDKTTSKLKEYIPGLDSITTSLKFLSQPSLSNNLSTNKLSQLSSVTGSVNELQGRLQEANEIQSFIRERETQLKEELMNTGLGKELLSINKEVYYYQQQLREYKELLNDKKRLEEKLLFTVRTLPFFKSFMEKHSYLAMLFPQPQNYDPSTALSGLQTRSGIQEIIAQRMGNPSNSNGINPGQYMQQQVQSAQTELNKLKDKINQSGGNSDGSDMTMPEFKPNDQKTKKFLDRLEYGINIQSSRSTYFLPVTSDIAGTIGYKFNDKSSMGLGLSYKLGWGSGWDNISFSSQGIGLRSYVDIKAKGKLWISGGFEYNYMQQFTKFDEIKNLDVWQKSVLAGITRKIQIGKKKETKIQLLYDFLACRQVPHSQPLKCRIGWNF